MARCRAAPDVCSARIKDHEGRYINIKISVTLYHIIIIVKYQRIEKIIHSYAYIAVAGRDADGGGGADSSFKRLSVPLTTVFMFMR